MTISPASVSCLGRLAGAAAVTSGLAYVAYFFVDVSVRDQSITAWNLLIVPAALWLGLVTSRRVPLVATVSTAAGAGASVLWAFAYRVPSLEPWWIGLATVWWLGIGWLLRADRRRLGMFTLLLGLATGVDFILTVLDAPMPIYALGGFKIPLTIVWTFWIGATLLRGRVLVSDATTTERENG